jgi:hypothetical protein
LNAPNPPRPYGFGTGSATIAGCESSPARACDNATYSAWRVSTFPVISGAKAAFTNR